MKYEIMKFDNKDKNRIKYYLLLLLYITINNLNKLRPGIFKWMINEVFDTNLCVKNDYEILMIKCKKYKLVGICVLKLSDNKICEFHIDNKHRRKGLGTTLINEVVKYISSPFTINIKKSVYEMYNYFYDKYYLNIEIEDD